MAGVFGGMTPQEIRGVVFDMDGVIIDSHPAHRRAWKLFLKSVGRDATEKELEFILDGRKRGEILRHFLGDLSPEQVQDYGERKDEMLRRLGNGIQPVEGAVEFLASLRLAGLRTAVATSAGRSRTRGTLAELGLLEYFDAIITGDEVAASKPDPLIYRLAAKRIEQNPHRLVAIEDAVSGVRAATGAGLRCIGIATEAAHAERLRAAGAFPVVPHFRFLSVATLTSPPLPNA
jgi:HAD superfamily hydrolase (TIGR01509 family)